MTFIFLKEYAFLKKINLDRHAIIFNVPCHFSRFFHKLLFFSPGFQGPDANSRLFKVFPGSGHPVQPLLTLICMFIYETMETMEK